MIRASRTAVVVALAATLVGGAVSLSGCSVVRNAVQGASGGKVDVGGTSVPSDYPKTDVPLTTGTVVYGAAVTSDGSRVWNVTIKVADRTATQAISTQLTGAGFTATASAGSDATGDTATFTKTPYSVIVLVSKPNDSTGWIANYTVTKAIATSSPTPSPTPTK